MTNKLAAMAKVMNNKSVLPILSSYLLEVKDDMPLEITASDLECVWHGSLPVTGQEGTGKVCITASTLLDAVKNLPEQEITFIIGDEDRSVTIQYANGRFEMAGQAADEYPAGWNVPHRTGINWHATPIRWSRKRKIAVSSCRQRPLKS